MRKNLNKLVTVKICITGIKQHKIFNSLELCFSTFDFRRKRKITENKGKLQCFRKAPYVPGINVNSISFFCF